MEVMLEFVDRTKFKQAIGIYKIINLKNQKVYIGQTKEGFQKRYWHHVWKLSQNTHDNRHLQNSWNKYGEENFEFQVIEVLNESMIDSRERYWIQFYRNQNICYNIQSGGQERSLVSYHSAESRKKVGEMNRKRLTGSKLPESTRRKMSESRTGRYIKRCSDVINDELAFKIKTMLVQGRGTKYICEQLDIPYKPVNGILSSNTWKHVYVEGWDDFQKNRSRGKNHPVNSSQSPSRPKTSKEIAEIKKLYQKLGTYSAVANTLEIDRVTVKKYVLQD